MSIKLFVSVPSREWLVNTNGLHVHSSCPRRDAGKVDSVVSPARPDKAAEICIPEPCSTLKVRR